MNGFTAPVIRLHHIKRNLRSDTYHLVEKIVKIGTVNTEIIGFYRIILKI